MVHWQNKFLSRATRLYTPLCPSVCRSVGPSVRRSVHRSTCHTLFFLFFGGFWYHCSCPNDMVTSITAPAHPHATGVAVYPALFFLTLSPQLSFSFYLFFRAPNFSSPIQRTSLLASSAKCYQVHSINIVFKFSNSFFFSLSPSLSSFVYSYFYFHLLLFSWTFEIFFFVSGKKEWLSISGNIEQKKWREAKPSKKISRANF